MENDLNNRDSLSLKRPSSPSFTDLKAISKLKSHNVTADKEDYDTLKRLYYENYFPYNLFFKWLNYGSKPSTNFTHREFSFTLANDIYIRYQSFENEVYFKDRIKRLSPEKIDIGAIYSSKPNEKKMIAASEFIPKQKELVFDIDLTDYDSVRTCCSEADICLKCWKFISLAMKIIHSILTEDFGYRHILWVYSGRRGVHAWVCDEKARNHSDEVRRAISDYIDINKASSNSNRTVNLGSTLHPSIRRSLLLVEEAFEGIILNDQKLFAHFDRADSIAKLLPDVEHYGNVVSGWNMDKSDSNERWNQLVQYVESVTKSRKNKPISTTLTTYLRDIKFYTVYPRLDKNVSININHLLKAPFCIHPKTRKICVPISPSEFDTFNPLTVPTDYQLIQQLDQFDKTSSSKFDIFKTSLGKYLKIFNSFIDGVIKDQISEPTLDF